jgi:hypothetical protein
VRRRELVDRRLPADLRLLADFRLLADVRLLALRVLAAGLPLLACLRPLALVDPRPLARVARFVLAISPLLGGFVFAYPRGRELTRLGHTHAYVQL